MILTTFTIGRASASERPPVGASPQSHPHLLMAFGETEVVYRRFTHRVWWPLGPIADQATFDDFVTVCEEATQSAINRRYSPYLSHASWDYLGVKEWSAGRWKP